MLQTSNKTEKSVKLFDLLIICPFAWVISQAGLNGNLLWVAIGYVLFAQYAFIRREW